MKKLLLAMFLLTAGMVATQSANAQVVIPTETKKVGNVPPAVSKDVESAIAFFYTLDPDGIYEVTWYSYKGKFYAALYVLATFQGAPIDDTFYIGPYSPQGERLPA